MMAALPTLPLPDELKRRIEKKLRRGWRLKMIRDDSVAKVGYGYQYFGSGFYSHWTKVLYPEGAKLLDVAEVEGEEGYDNGFIRGRWLRVRPKVKPLVLLHYRGDWIDAWGGPRHFNREIIVFI